MRPLEISPEEFHRLLARAASMTEEYLSSLPTRPVFPQTSGAETQQLFDSCLPQRGKGEAVLDDMTELFRLSRANNSRFFGYVQGSGEPVAMIGDLLASAMNQNITAWRSAPAAVTVERTVVRWLAESVGAAGFTGSLTGGGSSANLIGLAMARQSRARDLDVATVYLSTEAHMSIPKAISLLGLPRGNLRLVPVNREFRMRLDALESALAADVSSGMKPMAVVATAGTVNTGAIDPLRELARVARRHGAWFHIDGAYGGLAALAYPEKFIGLESADSLSLDPHKWLYQPVDCGCVLFQHPDVARAAFSQTGDYARVLSGDPIEAFAFFDESFELSRRFRALKLWLSLRYHGFEKFKESILQDVELAQSLGMKIAQHPELDLLAPVELSAVCFRYLPGGEETAAVDDLNARILARVITRGRVYLSNATINGNFALRACLVNHRTSEEDVQAVVDEVLAAAREVQRG